jgi:hypothetical protein
MGSPSVPSSSRVSMTRSFRSRPSGIVSPGFHDTPGALRNVGGGCAVVELEPERESVCHRSPFRLRLGPNSTTSVSRYSCE